MIARLVILAIAPPILVYTFFERLFTEIKSAFWFAQNDVLMEFHQVKRAWRAKSLHSRNWK